MLKIILDKEANRINVWNNNYKKGTEIPCPLDDFPDLGFEYDFLTFSDNENASNYYMFQSDYAKDMVKDQVSTVINFFKAWEAPIGTPDNPSWVQQRENAYALLDMEFEYYTKSMHRATSTERASWQVQIEEAIKYTEDPEAFTPFIDALLLGRNNGESKSELVDKIKLNHELYTLAFPMALGKYQQARSLIRQATTPEDLAKIDWKY